MEKATPTSSRPHTPESPFRSLANSTDNVLHFDDDLTNALNTLRNFTSRATTPLELACCCGREDCEAVHLWRDACHKLEKELVLSAEVGQALLHRHEAYVRSQQAALATTERTAQLYSESREKVARVTASNNQLVAKMSHLVKENNVIEKRLMQTMLNLEVADSSNRTLLNEVQDARGTIAKLSSQSMKSVGWESKIYSLEQERDDLKEERKAEASRARSAEAKVAALTEKCTRLQADLYNMREERENRRLSKADLSEEIIRDARLRLDALQVAVSQTSHPEDAEFTRVLESLVSENEALKHDNAELQNLLNDSREDIRALREEVEEQRAAAVPNLDAHQEGLQFYPIRSPARTHGHRTKESWASTSSAPLPLSPTRTDGYLSPRLATARIRRPSYPLAHVPRTPLNHTRKSPSDLGDEKHLSEGTSQEVDVVPPSPSASAIASRRTSISRHSNYSIEVDSAAQRDADKSSPPKGRRKQLLLLTRTTGTQTDPVFILPSSPHPPSMLDEHTPSGTHSETSSLQEGRMSQFSILLDKINNLLHRIAQADVRTLTNRLKRQHLAGADVGHLSRTTISGILNEVSSLRTHFRTILDDERSTTLVSRKEFRALLKVYSELFQEIGSLRATVNEVVLNPQIAIKLRDEAMDSEDKGRAAPKAVGALGGWIAPLSKLWATSSSDTPDTTGGPPSLSPGLMRTGSTRNRLQPPRIAPKLAPAISASTTTVNVEFTNAGIRRAISTTPAPPAAVQVPTERLAPSPLSQNRPQLRGIFVGSSGTATKQTPANKQKDPWAMAPAGGVGSASRLDQAKLRSARPTAGGVNRLASGDKVDSSRRMSRVVDAMVDQHAVDDDDDEGGDFPSNLLQRTLRPRGLSDSSIHSTFIAHGPPLNRMVTPAGLALSSPTMESSVRGITSVGIGGITPWLDRDSVLQSISRKMQSFRFATGSDQLRTKELPDENVPQVNVGAITGSSTPSGTPTASATQLPITGSSPPRPILAQPSRSNTRRVENSLSPIARTPLHDEARRGSPKVAGGLPGITSWANPRLQHVLEGHDEEAMGSYRGSDSTIGRTYARPRGL